MSTLFHTLSPRRSSPRALAWTAFGCLLVLPACIAGEMPASHICDEIGSALASRAFACTGKTGEGNDVYEKFEDSYECLVEDYDGDEFERTIGGVQPEQAFACPAAIRKLDCDVAKSTDIEATLAATPAACASFVAPK